jgi:hypothetical protein
LLGNDSGFVIVEQVPNVNESGESPLKIKEDTNTSTHDALDPI